ncbi:hypothetical protein J3R82DRAFT_2051 [Butyriboletus roseoflavus]|nr:hypothetical protein J3R82DRAFT_2051 [Butyriboletus roseoflavus]
MLGTYLQINSLIGLDIHIDETFAMIERELIVFSEKLQKYIKTIEHSDIAMLKLDGNFPKAHLWKHVIWDIQPKRVAHNYSTCPNEKMHSTLKDAYADQSNGKNRYVIVFFRLHNI